MGESFSETNVIPPVVLIDLKKLEAENLRKAIESVSYIWIYLHLQYIYSRMYIQYVCGIFLYTLVVCIYYMYLCLYMHLVWVFYLLIKNPIFLTNIQMEMDINKMSDEVGRIKKNISTEMTAVNEEGVKLGMNS